MKKLFYILSFGILLGTLAMIGCSSDDDGGPTIEEQQINALEGTWTTGGDTNNVRQGTDPGPGDWGNFTMTFTSGGQVSVNGESTAVKVFDFSNTTYTVSGNSAEQFQIEIGEDVLSVAVTSASAIVITFTLDDANQAIGRTKSVNGLWTFNLTRS